MRQLTWENFRATILVAGEQRSHRVSEQPVIELFGDGLGNRMGIWLECGMDEQIPPDLEKLNFIASRKSKKDGRLVLEIATSRRDLYKQFYHFGTAVAERLVVEKRSPVEALVLELQCFTDLFAEKGILGIERQIGLVGELLFLRLMWGRKGMAAVDAWLGPFGEPHDFRIGKREFEVKATTSTQRTHTINGLEQLVPSDECDLFLVSILLGPAGSDSGITLVELVSELSTALAGAKEESERLASALEACGFRPADAAHYSRRYVLRRPMAIVRVDKSCPAITRHVVQTALGSLATRVGSLQYEVTVEGLEHEEGTPQFDGAVT
jgi:hypothetical protein